MRNILRAALACLGVLALAPAARAEVQVVVSTLTRPADTTAYALNDLIASSTTAASVVVPHLLIPFPDWMISRLRLSTTVATGWDASTVKVRLWTAAPTYTNGDNGAYAVATGAAGYLGSCAVTLSQSGDGASGNCAPDVGAGFAGRNVTVFWDLQDTSGALTPASAQTFTLSAEVLH